MDRFRNNALPLAISRVGLAPHPEKRYTLTALGVPACSGKMNNIVKKQKDYRMDIICRDPHNYRALGGLARKERRYRAVWRIHGSCSSSKVIVFFYNSQQAGKQNLPPDSGEFTDATYAEKANFLANSAEKSLGYELKEFFALSASYLHSTDISLGVCGRIVH